MIAALYVQVGGAYYGLEDVEPWGLPDRDARLYAGPWPVVAHPPCQRWSKLAGLVEHRYGIPRHKDGGCFASAVASVRRWGGVLEHPAFSDAWWFHHLPKPPTSGGWVRGIDGGWACHVEQGHYGHKAPKPTWLYAFGVECLPGFVWGVSAAEMRLNSWYPKETGRVARKEVPKSQRAATPPAFRDLLLSIARSAIREAA